MNENIPDKIVLPPHPAPKKIETGPNAGREIRFAGTLVLNDYKDEYARFEDAIDEVLGIDGMLCTDETRIVDFIDDQIEVDQLARYLGVAVSHRDLVIEVLSRMRPSLDLDRFLPPPSRE